MEKVFVERTGAKPQLVVQVNNTTFGQLCEKSQSLRDRVYNNVEWIKYSEQGADGEIKDKSKEFVYEVLCALGLHKIYHEDLSLAKRKLEAAEQQCAKGGCQGFKGQQEQYEQQEKELQGQVRKLGEANIELLQRIDSLKGELFGVRNENEKLVDALDGVKIDAMKKMGIRDKDMEILYEQNRERVRAKDEEIEVLRKKIKVLEGGEQ